MQIEQVNLRDRIEQVRLSFDTQLAEVLVGRPDLSQASYDTSVYGLAFRSRPLS